MGGRLEQNLACLRVMAGCIASWCVWLILNVLKNRRTMPCLSLASWSCDLARYTLRVLGSAIESTKRRP